MHDWKALGGTDHVIEGETLPAMPERAVNTTPVVNVIGAEEGLVVGPDEVLVITFRTHTPDWELKELAKLLLDAGLGNHQFALVRGWNIDMAKVRRERPAIDPTTE